MDIDITVKDDRFTDIKVQGLVSDGLASFLLMGGITSGSKIPYQILGEF